MHLVNLNGEVVANALDGQVLPDRFHLLPKVDVVRPARVAIVAEQLPRLPLRDNHLDRLAQHSLRPHRRRVGLGGQPEVLLLEHLARARHGEVELAIVVDAAVPSPGAMPARPTHSLLERPAARLKVRLEAVRPLRAPRVLLRIRATAASAAAGLVEGETLGSLPFRHATARSPIMLPTLPARLAPPSVVPRRRPSACPVRVAAVAGPGAVRSVAPARGREVLQHVSCTVGGHRIRQVAVEIMLARQRFTPPVVAPERPRLRRLRNTRLQVPLHVRAVGVGAAQRERALDPRAQLGGPLVARGRTCRAEGSVR